MRKIISILLVISCWSLAQANNQSAFQQVQQLLAKAKNISGDYTQTREIKLLSKPLVSTGTFVLSQAEGLIWNQMIPFKSQLKLSDNRLEQKLGDNPPTVLTKEQQPIIFSFSNIFLSIFKGNTTDLKQYFTIDFQGGSALWTIALKPKASPLNKAIARIELSGTSHIDKVVINEVRGNQMQIKFSKVKVEE